MASYSFPSPETSGPDSQPASGNNAEQGRDPAELYRALVDTLPDGIVITDLEGKVAFASAVVLKLFEVVDPAQILGSSVLDWVEPEDQARMAEHLHNAPRNVFAEDNQYRFHTAHGRRFIGEINAALLYDAEGVPNGLIGTIRDVTDRFMANEALMLSEGRLRRMVDDSPVGMHFYRLDPGDRLVLEDANPAAERILGIPHAPLVGRTIEEAFPGLEETEVPSAYRRLAAQGGQWHTEQIVYDHDEINGAYEVVAFQSLPGHMVASFTDITRRRRAEAQLLERNEALRTSIEHEQLLRTLDQLIIGSDSVQANAEALLQPIISYFKADAAEILAYAPEAQEFRQIAGAGFLSDLYLLPVPQGSGLPGVALRTHGTVYLPDLYSGEMRIYNEAFFRAEKLVSGYSALLQTPRRIQGVLQIFYRHTEKLPEPTLAFFEMVAGQVAIALEKASLWENHQKALVELVDAYASTLEGWVYALDLRDKETEDHTQRVTELTVALAEAVAACVAQAGGPAGCPAAFSPSQLADLRRGALLHDIGKIGIPDAILHKPGPLTNEEWRIMRRHPEFAYRMLEPIAYLHGAIDIPYCHHERWDGSGYPRGLKGEAIPLAARIFAVVDVWDALTSDRPYRKAWPPEQAEAYLKENAGILFDPRVVEAFFGMKK